MRRFSRYEMYYVILNVDKYTNIFIDIWYIEKRTEYSVISVSIIKSGSW